MPKKYDFVHISNFMLDRKILLQFESLVCNCSFDSGSIFDGKKHMSKMPGGTRWAVFTQHSILDMSNFSFKNQPLRERKETSLRIKQNGEEKHFPHIH